jgi:predicted ATPase
MRMQLADGVLDLDQGSCVRAGVGEDRLTDIERRLLRYLALRPGVEVGREELQREVWGYRKGVLSRTVFTTVGRVRAKIEAVPSQPVHLLTVGKGYCFQPLGRAAHTPVAHVGDGALGPLIGRDGSLAEIEALFAAGARLVSLLGPGGIGKTRLALGVAARHAGPCAVVALEPVLDVDRVPGAVAAALNHSMSGGPDPWGELDDLVGDGELLLVLDNLEHLPGLGERLGRCLQAAPHLRLLVTSRVRAEHGYVVGPLDLPGEGQAVGESAAGAMLLAHGRRARPGWVPDPEDDPVLLSICRRVGGSPLGIELAAAWLRLLEPTDLLAELEGSIVLHSDELDRPDRHRSIAASLAASWNLLAPSARASLEALSTCTEPFDLNAAREIAGADLLTLGQLVDASMVLRVGAGFDLHPLVRQDARRRLAEDPARRELHAARHARLHLDRLCAAVHALDHGQSDELRLNHEDTLSAWADRCRNGEVDALTRAAYPLYRYLDMGNRLPELFGALSLADAALTDRPEHGPARLALHLLHAGAGRPPTVAPDQVAAVLEPVGLPLRAAALCHGAIALLIGGAAGSAVALAGRALEVAGDNPFIRAFSLAVRGAAATRMGQLDAARSDLVAAMAGVGDRRSHGRPYVHLGELELLAGNLAVARRHLEAALAVCRESDDRTFATLALCRLGQVMAAQGESDGEVLGEAVEEGVASRLPRVWWGLALEGLGARWLADEETEARRDGVVYLAAAAAQPGVEGPMRATALLADAASRVGPGEWHAASREGRTAADTQLLAILRRRQG